MKYRYSAPMAAQGDSENDLKLYHMIALVAARDGKIEALTQTLDAHPQLCARSSSIELLHTACTEGRMDCADALLSRGVPINVIDAQGFSAIDHAILHHQWHSIEPLLERGADPNGSQRGYRRGKPTPLLTAAHEGQPDIMNALIQHGARPHYHDSRGENILHHAARAKTNQKEVMTIAKSVATKQMMTHENCEHEEPMNVAIHQHNHAALEVLQQADVQHHRRRARGLNAGRVPIQKGLFSERLEGDSKPNNRGR